MQQTFSCFDLCYLQKSVKNEVIFLPRLIHQAGCCEPAPSHRRHNSLALIKFKFSNSAPSIKLMLTGPSNLWHDHSSAASDKVCWDAETSATEHVPPLVHGGIYLFEINLPFLSGFLFLSLSPPPHISLQLLTVSWQHNNLWPSRF